MREIPDGTAAVLTNTGSVFHPVWKDEEDQKWRGEMVFSGAEKDFKAGGVYVILPATVERALNAGQYDIWKIAQKYGLEMPPEKR